MTAAPVAETSLVHVDLFFTILVPLLLILSGSSFIFGGAKPVPVGRVGHWPLQHGGGRSRSEYAFSLVFHAHAQ